MIVRNLKTEKSKKENKFSQVIFFNINILVCFLPVFSLCMAGRRGGVKWERRLLFLQNWNHIVYNVNTTFFMS